MERWLMKVQRKFDGTALLSDWAGRDIDVNDSVLWAAREGTLRYGKITAIHEYTGPARRYATDLVDQFKIQIKRDDGVTQTIDSQYHPYAFASLTKFKTLDDSIYRI